MERVATGSTRVGTHLVWNGVAQRGTQPYLNDGGSVYVRPTIWRQHLGLPVHHGMVVDVPASCPPLCVEPDHLILRRKITPADYTPDTSWRDYETLRLHQMCLGSYAAMSAYLGVSRQRAEQLVSRARDGRFKAAADAIAERAPTPAWRPDRC
jgi:hypothetical protein